LPEKFVNVLKAEQKLFIVKNITIETFYAIKKKPHVLNMGMIIHGKRSSD
jgi:hypothetical protein